MVTYTSAIDLTICTPQLASGLQREVPSDFSGICHFPTKVSDVEFCIEQCPHGGLHLACWEEFARQIIIQPISGFHAVHYLVEHLTSGHQCYPCIHLQIVHMYSGSLVVRQLS